MSEPREYTPEEVRTMFLDHIRNMVRYWAREDRVPDVEEKLEGLAFSILVTLDGGADGLPAFDVVPSPHEADKDYHRDNGENWFPSGVPLPGALHEYPHKVDPKKNA